MNESEARATLLRRLVGLAERLPNGLLFRLVEDAQFFYDWNLMKKSARKSSRLKQSEAQRRRAEDQHWKDFKQRFG